MNFALNNVTTTDGYSDPNTLDGLNPCQRVNIDVNNAAIYWQIRQSIQETQIGNWSQEVFMSPGSRTISRQNIVGVRVRSAAAGVAAQVTIEAVAG